LANTIIDKEALHKVSISIINGMLQNNVPFDYLDLIWHQRTGDSIKLRKMSRSHVRNTLQWCIRKGAGPDDEKDGIRYADWIAYFTTRLLDPELGE
jgi:hypothetical protein